MSKKRKMGPRSHRRTGGPCYRCFLNDRAIARMNRLRRPSPPPPAPLPESTWTLASTSPPPHVIHMGQPRSPSPEPTWTLHPISPPSPRVIHMGQPRSPSPEPTCESSSPKKIKNEPASPLSSADDDDDEEWDTSSLPRPWRFPTPESENHAVEVPAPANNQLGAMVVMSQIYPPTFYEKRLIWILSQLKR